VGGHDGFIYDGRSVCVNSAGTVVGRAAAFAEDVLLVDLIKPGEKAVEDTLIKEADLWQALVTGTRDFVHKCGFSSVVLGLSGGLDSSLVAAIAVEALGPDKVLGVLLPSPYTREESITLAHELTEALGIKTVTIPLEPMMRSFETGLAPVFEGRPQDVTEENLQSRIRGTLLMSLANKFGHLLLNTGNKSESAMGYCTLYGDSCGALCVIGDVYKTQAYALCRWLNGSRGKRIIPEGTITRAPSAELRPGQVDQDSLPPYDVLDPILHDLIEMGMDEDSLNQVGYDKQALRTVLSMVRRAEFKRRQAPPALSVSSRAFGAGWHMPLARW
jgi:NAD+ synthetase